MASSPYASSTETTYASRVGRVLLGPCSDQLRDILRYHVKPVDFPRVIKQQRSKLPKLTKPQMDLILPQAGNYSGNYSDMDISLLYLLLRNICKIPAHSAGWGKHPLPSDITLAANIEIIRNSRNLIGHSISASLSHKEFNDIWSALKTAVAAMDAYLNNNNTYEKELDFLKNETMDPDEAKEYEDKIRKQSEEDAETRKLITETKMKIVETNEQMDENKQWFHQKQEETLRQLNIHTSQIADLQHEVQQKQDMLDKNLDFNELKQKLLELNEKETQSIPLTQIQEGGNKLPIEQLFSSVVVKETSNDSQQPPKQVKIPDDILTINDSHVSGIYMLGDAAHGKTTYCMWLLKHWCNAQKFTITGKQLNDWEVAFGKFDFVFHVALGHVDPSIANVKDMICQDIFGSYPGLQEQADHVLSCSKYSCFVILDGLDEWKPNQLAIDKLKYKEFPNLHNMSECLIFITMRPWKFTGIASLLNNKSRVIEILGLDDNGINEVINKVLVHHYKIKQGSAEYKKKHEEIISKLKDTAIKSFIQIPLLAVVCVQIWYGNRQVGNSMTSFYSVMTDMLIERALIQNEFPNLRDKEHKYCLPGILSEDENIKSYFSTLLKLGKVAYVGLISQKTKLTFEKRWIEREIGKEELRFALAVGLISQREAPSLLKKTIILHFFHKSIQEFLAALLISTIDSIKNMFFKKLTSIESIKEFSNVIMFICGMCPSMGSLISQRAASLADEVKDICEYRESDGGVRTVIELYKLRVSWYMEMKNKQKDHPLAFHASDVYVRYDSDKDTLRGTRELLSDENVRIKTLCLLSVPTHGEASIPDTVLDAFLSNSNRTDSLEMVYIYGTYTDRSVHTISGPNMRKLFLWNVSVRELDSVDSHVLSNMTRLEKLYLYNISLVNREIGLTKDMTQLRQVNLNAVLMPPSSWRRLIKSLIDIHHHFSVRLDGTNIDTDSKKAIKSSRHFSEIKEYITLNLIYELEFIRRWPQTKKK